MTENKAWELPDQRVFLLRLGLPLRCEEDGVSFTFNHFLRPVHSLGFGWLVEYTPPLYSLGARQNSLIGIRL